MRVRKGDLNGTVRALRFDIDGRSFGYHVWSWLLLTTLAWYPQYLGAVGIRHNFVEITRPSL
jgi:hypothetical protein